MTYVPNSSKEKLFNESFSLRVPNGFEIDIILLGEYDPNELGFLNLTTTSVPNPEFRVVDDGIGWHKIKIFFQKDQYEINTTHEFLFFDKKLKNNKLKKPNTGFSLLPYITAPEKLKKAGSNTKKFLNWGFRFIAGFILLSATYSALYLLDKAYESKTGGYLYKFMAKTSIENISGEVIDIKKKSTKKDHFVFDSEEFKELEKEMLEEGVFLRDLYSYSNNNLFVMRNLSRLVTKNEDGSFTESKEPKFSKRSEAIEFCEIHNARLPTRNELDSVMVKHFAKQKDLFYRIKTESEYPEWVIDEIGDYYDIYMKNGSLPPINSRVINGVKTVGDSETYSNFRCVFETKDFE